MNIGVLGSGDVGRAIASGFSKQGSNVFIGTRHPEKLAEWIKTVRNVHVTDYEEACKTADLIVIAVKGSAATSVIRESKINNFDHKIVIDITNPLRQNEGAPPTLFTAFPHSLGEEIQQLLVKSYVVKAFNTVPAMYMTHAQLHEGKPDLFIAGNDMNAKKKTTEIAKRWGWGVIDIGGIDQAYLLEALALIWIRYGFLNNHWTHAFKLLSK